MTERTTEPTMADVLSAVQGFGTTYHDLHLSVEALRDELKRHDAESRKDRAGIREMVHALQRSVDRRFDALGREIDTHSEQIAELQQARTELTMRLHSLVEQYDEIADLRTRLSQVDARLTALEELIGRGE